MLQVWRIVKEKHAATAFSGEGARLYGGRWNSAGTAMVYTSATKALAALETLVHLNPPVLFKYVVIPIRFDEALVERVKGLPAGWMEQPPPRSVQVIGDAWVRERRSAVLEVPSVIVPGEFHYLLNPVHADFRKVAMGKAEVFAFDPRLM
jgi:RES domain-containing protein